MALVMRTLGGLLLWAAGFSLLYALHGLGCGLGWGSGEPPGYFTALNLGLLFIWLLLLGSAGWIVRMATRAYSRDGDTVLSRTQLVSAWAGLAGLFFTGAPVLLSAHCV
ncbi:hypothetical protein ASE63_00600 [Bosea sp. Root381]|uniref:hypothetical protein n=1 Tax=Bosea sp. Root381 TaxID=1736524 RepID=UPI0006F7B742|nr:hypothetical protein [Bosea sp. Root381]KRE17740.1 hypothetical protein ASE63_00600 [Bosea sp. Root381]